jgi:hypothetical protein
MKRFLAEMNGEAVAPDYGPAWREAQAAGLDMSLIEHSLKQSPAQRLATHQQLLDFVLEVQKGRTSGGSRWGAAWGFR